ncbi:MAG TPA: HAD family phosphatase [Hanamia sp.]|nr:HAD family phosphatase [Hanamia sp.]
MTGKQDQVENNFCKAVIFDMDGTLIDSTRSDFLAWQRLFSYYNKTITYEDYMPMLGIKSAEIVKQYLPVKNDEEVQFALTQKLVFFHEIISENGIQPVAYADVFLKQIKQLNIPAALATSSRRAKMEMVMEKLNLLIYFDTVVTGGDVKNGKPAPDIFIKASEKLGVPPQDCIVFEDAANGVKAAKNAFMKCVALSSTQSPEELQDADLIIDTFKNLSFRELCLQLKSGSK